MQGRGCSPDTLPQLRQSISPDEHGDLINSPSEREKELFRTEVPSSGSRTNQLIN